MPTLKAQPRLLILSLIDHNKEHNQTFQDKYFWIKHPIKTI